MKKLIAQIWCRVRAAWRTENYPAWRLSLPNPLPRGHQEDQGNRAQRRLREEHLLVEQGSDKLE
jgi:hypothetical protein